MFIEIQSVNKNTDRKATSLGNNVLRCLGSFSDHSVNRLADVLTDEKIENKIVIITKPVTYHPRDPETSALNGDYAYMQNCIKNGSEICSVLGIVFNIKQHRKYERDYSLLRRVTRVNITYTITLKNIEFDKLKERANAYQVSCEDNAVQQIRNSCIDFYRHVYNSDVVEMVSEKFAEKIKNLAAENFISSFQINVHNGGITLDNYDDRYVNFSFAEHGLEGFFEKKQRLGFALSVIDKITLKLKNDSVLASRDNSVITNKMRLLSKCNFAEKFTCEEFKLSFQKIVTPPTLNKWF